MELRFVICAFLSTLAFCGCGGADTTNSKPQDSSSATVSDGAEADKRRIDRRFRSDAEGRFATIALGPGRAEPRIRPSSKSPPKRVLVRDLEVGDGPIVDQGDRASFYYFGVNYKTGKEQFYRWPPEPIMKRVLGDDPWEKGLIGMKEGGLREMIIPSLLLFGDGTVNYVFEMVRVEDRPKVGE
jgi:peptidylprolyl isomerase